MRKFKYIITALTLASCAPGGIMNPIGDTPESQLEAANMQMQFTNKPTAIMMVAQNLDAAIKTYKERNDNIGIGNAYNIYGKAYKVLEHNGQKDEQYQLQAISYYQKANYNPGLAVGYGEMMQADFVQGKKADACHNGSIAIEKFEAAKTTHPGITIPVYTSNLDFGGFVKRMMQQQGCGA